MQVTPLNDQQLIFKYLDGDERAFEELLDEANNLKSTHGCKTRDKGTEKCFGLTAVFTRDSGEEVYKMGKGKFT